MAILSREDYFRKINDVIGTNTDDDSMSFIEDMTDTYNDMEQRTLHADGDDWEKRYHELDESWRKKYKDRFFSGSGQSAIPLTGESGKKSDPPAPTAETITIDDLFK